MLYTDYFMDTIEINSIDRISDAAAWVLEHAQGRRIVAFFGSMGAGKTTLIRGICDLLGVEDCVTSPTFAIVNQYLTADDEPVYHFDFYRLEKPEEAFDMGYEEYFDSGALCLVEWPEKIDPLLPPDTLRVYIETDPGREEFRRISIG